MLYSWAANFKHQLSAEHVRDLPWTADVLSYAGRDHTLNVYDQEIGKDVTFPKHMYENKLWWNLINKLIRNAAKISSYLIAAATSSVSSLAFPSLLQLALKADLR